MGVILKDASGADLALNWWTWRPIVELLRRKGLVDDQRAEMLQINGVGAALDNDTAAATARVVGELVASMPEGSRLMRDGTVTTEPHGPQPVSEMNEKWYGALRESLRSFGDFCGGSGGFTVY